MWWPFRRSLRTPQRIGAIRRQLVTLDAALASGALNAEQYAVERRALGDSLLDDIAHEPRHSAAARYSAIAVCVLMPFAAFAFFQWRGTQPPLQAHASTMSTAAPLMNHGIDINTSIAKLAAKLGEHPDDAEGWALLGRTYKATERYPEARDAFKHAVAAAPGDAGFEREYAAAATPNEVVGDEPEQCPIPGMKGADGASTSGSSACNTGPNSAVDWTVLSNGATTKIGSIKRP